MHLLFMMHPVPTAISAHERRSQRRHRSLVVEFDFGFDAGNRNRELIARQLHQPGGIVKQCRGILGPRRAAGVSIADTRSTHFRQRNASGHRVMGCGHHEGDSSWECETHGCRS